MNLNHTLYKANHSLKPDRCFKYQKQLIQSMTLELSMGVANRPRDDKVSDGGDDAWFITNSVINAVGVADGVGSWRSRGINAGECARELMELCRQQFVDNLDISPTSVLEYSIPKLRSAGSTTILIAKITEEGFLSVAQIGDSDLVVFRRNFVAFQTLPQQHRHNLPYQVGRSEPDSASDAQTYELSVQVGDIIVLGTDGLWDNLYASQVLQIITEATDQSPAALARLLTDRAYVASNQDNIWSPFAQRAYEQGIIKDTDFESHLGGKPDDITVVVCRVSE